ncbi:right-handed parallel beta-helix repeat-containing protein [Haloferula chungangensis]|uniref:Right-handed parallel beta-helix repeat-containing protein n=1 Tax=Haloferula chungangensis TaxID=1048331 RepID=A0ABW2L8A5_9BACT
MKPLHALTCLIGIANFSSSAIALDLHVSPSGNDSNPGSADKPVATLHKAQELLRASDERGKEAVDIILGEGIHYLGKPLVLEAADSGTKDAPVTFRATEGKTAVISGGADLGKLDWQLYQDGILMAKVPNGTAIDILYVNDETMPMARYPNFDPKAQYFNGTAADAFSKEKAAEWQNPAGGFMHAMHKAKWGGMHYRITGKNDKGELTHEGGWQNNRPSPPHPDIRFVENIFEELDAPREWFLNAETSTLYFYPPKDLDLDKARFQTARLENLVEFSGSEESPAKFIELSGLTFSHAARTFMKNKERLLRTDWTVNRSGAVFLDGAEDVSIENCHVREVGGNAIFVNDYNRRITIKGCHIEQAGGNGVAIIGDQKAVRDGLVGYGSRTTFEKIDKTPGPKSNNFPAEVLVEDCLIHDIGRVEKQTAGVEIDIAMHITVRHVTVHDVPRAGINIGAGNFGGHVIDFCDVFDTVMETGDHGSFNSWGRDRFWKLKDVPEKDMGAGDYKDTPFLDVIHPITISNSRWRCDHGWDIDLDDGSSNYHIFNNLCLNGGIKNREGFKRTVENNIMVNNSLHPHVWYPHSGDIFRNNIVFESYRPAIMPTSPWGKEFDHNLYVSKTKTGPALPLAGQSKRDEHSIFGDPKFLDPEKGDYRVADDSPALKLGFKNFPMDQFGVTSPELKKLARSPKLPIPGDPAEKKSKRDRREQQWLGAKVKNIVGMGEVSATGLPEETGVRLLEVPKDSVAANAGLQKSDVIIECNGKPTDTFAELQGQWHIAKGKVELGVWRGQEAIQLTIEKAP